MYEEDNCHKMQMKCYIFKVQVGQFANTILSITNFKDVLSLLQTNVGFFWGGGGIKGIILSAYLPTECLSIIFLNCSVGFSQNFKGTLGILAFWLEGS